MEQVNPQVPVREVQTTSHLMMIRPVRFGFNEQTAGSNAFQQRDSAHTSTEIQALALAEFEAFVARLREAGVVVTVFDDTPVPHTPDSIFPNNWISFHHDGKIVLYPMYAPNRRAERRLDIVDHFARLYPEPKVIDLSHYEAEERYLESTGSMAMDRVHQRVYACISPRTDPGLFAWFCQEMACEGMLFHAVDEAGQAIYHTNVMMALGAEYAVVCMEAIRDGEEQRRLRQALEETGHEIIPISYAQMHAFAGNMLEVYNQDGQPLTVMSQRAYASLEAWQLDKLRGYGGIVVGPLDVIETYGGGSVRCMMAEVFW